jgi:CubicO group peptidase (beta-lactamase class C family)
MKNIVYLIVFSIIIGCSSKTETLKTTDDVLTKSIDSIMNANYLPNEPGAAIIISKNGKETYSKGFGMANLELNVPMKSEMIFRLGSITKQFTAVSILLLEEQSKLSVKDDICKYLPEYPTHDDIITIENLLTHTSGIPNFTGFPNGFEIEQMKLTTTELLDLFKDKPLDFKTGERFSYSNSGYAVLGAIIESVSKMSYEEFIEIEIFEKLGMKSSSYDHPEEVVKNKISGYDKDSLGYRKADYSTMCAPFSAGALRSNVKDLALWNKSIHGGKLIQLKSLVKAFKPFKLNSGELSNYGFGWQAQEFMGHTNYHHAGGIFGFLTSGFYFPKEDLYVAVLSNNTSSNPELVNSLISSKLLDESESHSVNKDNLLNLTGTYVIDNSNIEITKDSNELYFDATWKKGKLIARSNEEFYVDGTIMGCTFNQDSTGIVKSITIKHRFFGDKWYTANRILE